MSWTCNNGIRVESASDHLFRELRRAGCYRVSFGFESGNNDVLKMFGKGGRASLEQGRIAVQKARAAGVDTNGFFLLGLSVDTEETMRETIGYARSLQLDSLLFGITIALPGTKMFNDYYREHLIRSFDWDQYFAWTSEDLFSHRRLDHDSIQKYMKMAYRKTILGSPAFLYRRFLRGLRTGELYRDLYYGLKFFLLPAATAHDAYDYYARKRWPRHDFHSNRLQPVEYQQAARASRPVASGHER